jgi:HEAT repeat protein
MSRRSSTAFIVLALLVVFGVVVFAVVRGTQADAPPTPEELVQKAEDAPTGTEREKAVLDLATTGPSAEDQLRRLLVESKKPEVRAAAIEGLNSLSAWNSMPQILQALEDPSVQVRGRAGAAATRMLGIDFLYRAEDPPEQRAKAVKGMRSCYSQMQKAASSSPEAKKSSP